MRLPNPFLWLARRFRSGPIGRTIRKDNRVRPMVEVLEALDLPSGTWNQLVNLPPTSGGTAYGVGTMLLLTDGEVMAQRGGVVGSDDITVVTKQWNLLKPDSRGGYFDATWSPAASMVNSRLYYASNMLSTGKVFFLGGEYSFDSVGNFVAKTNTGETYDSASNNWATTDPFPEGGQDHGFGDAPTAVLPGGKILAGYRENNHTYVFNSNALGGQQDPQWSQTGSKLHSDQSSEESWMVLPDNSVFSYDIWGSIDPNYGNGTVQA